MKGRNNRIWTVTCSLISCSVRSKSVILILSCSMASSIIWTSDFCIASCNRFLSAAPGEYSGNPKPTPIVAFVGSITEIQLNASNSGMILKNNKLNRKNVVACLKELAFFQWYCLFQFLTKPTEINTYKTRYKPQWPNHVLRWLK